MRDIGLKGNKQICVNYFKDAKCYERIGQQAMGENNEEDLY